MPDFNEKLLQFIWQYRLLNPGPIYTTTGTEITVVRPGELNLDSGPDFFNGQIKFKDFELAGNIEVHLKTSDWLKHGHQQNKNYDRLILHVVYEHDVELDQNLNHGVEVLALKNLVPEKTIQTYDQLFTSKEKLPCAKQLKDVDELKFVSWLERMAIERLEEKVKRITQQFESCKGDYTQTFYSILLRNFGFKVNGLPFEMLSKNLPVQLLLKHADNLMQLEALLLGMCGFLEDQYNHKYIQLLQYEFSHLKNKYSLNPLPKELFKFSRLRPANFPTLRLAQFAALINQQPGFLANPQNLSDVGELKKLLSVKPAGYFKNHYTFDGKTSTKELSLGGASLENLIVNSIAPFYFFYAKKLSKPVYAELAIGFLTRLTFEKNNKTKLFANKQSVLKSAADSQGIINLYDNYCIKKQCLNCGIGTAVLKPDRKYP